MLRFNQLLLLFIIVLSFAPVIAENEKGNKTEVPLQKGSIASGTPRPSKAPLRYEIPIQVFYDSGNFAIEIVSDDSISLSFSMYNDNCAVIQTATYNVNMYNPAVINLGYSLTGNYTIEIIIDNIILIGEINL